MTNNAKNLKNNTRKKRTLSEAEHRRVQARQRRLQEDPSVPLDIAVCIMTAFGFGALIFVTVLAFVSARKSHGDYLYAVEDFDNGPVVELMAINSTLPNGTIPAAHPNFLYATKQENHRLVEFYAPWCGHCQHYRSKYVGTAREIQNITHDSPENIEFYAISCTVHQALCRQQNVRAYPAVRFFKAGSNNGTDINPFSHPFEILDKMGISSNGKRPSDKSRSSLFDAPRNINKKSWSSLFSWKRIEPSQSSLRSKQNLFSDAWLSFDFAMRHGVFVQNGPLNNVTQSDFVDWIELLHMTLPPTWKIHNALNAIRLNYDSVMKNEAALVKVLDENPPSVSEWSNDCTSNSFTNHNQNAPITDSTGYTCGLWQLAHIMSVGVVEYNKHAVETNENLETLTVASIFRNYISNFFGCQECRLNFLSAYDACAYDGCNRLSSVKSPLEAHWEQLPLWLWETHNGVNLRLQKEDFDREQQSQKSAIDNKRVQWPGRRDCPKCWREDGSWSEDVVYKFLRIQYWPDDNLTDEHRKEVLPLSLQTKVIHKSTVPLWFSIPVSTLMLYGVWWYMQRVRRIKSGLHKKKELDV